jgi:hypothetical protein
MDEIRRGALNEIEFWRVFFMKNHDKTNIRKIN